MNKKQIIVLIIVVVSIIGNIICLIIAGASLAIYNAYKITNVKSNITENYSDITTHNQNNYFDGSIYYNPNPNEVNQIFTITVPNNFKKNNNEYIYEINEENKSSECTFSLKEIINYDDAKKLAYSMNEFYSSQNKVQTLLINNITWYETKYDFLGINYNYLTKLNKKVYIFDFEIDNELLNECEIYKNDILNSISLK